jgi:hypothetical protein
MAALAAVWLLAVAGYLAAKDARMTADKVRAYVESVDFSRLSAADRAKAIRRLAGMLNALSLEERRRARGDIMDRWFSEMTEEEKGEYIEATMPTGFKQMLTAFEQLPEDKRRKTVDNALKSLREAREKMQSGQALPPGTNTNQPPLSPELEDKIKTIGLQAYYSQSSAQTKAELAPVLEEMQNVMQMGGNFHGQ